MTDDWLENDGLPSEADAQDPTGVGPRLADEARARTAAGYPAPDGSGGPPPRETRASLDAIRDIPLPPIPTRERVAEITDDWQQGPATASQDQLPARRGNRAERRATSASTKQSRTWLVGAAVASLAVVTIAGVGLLGFHEPVTARLAGSGGTWKAQPPLTGASARPVVATPLFAHIGDLKIHLPIDPKKITGVAFHQAAYGHSYHMVSDVPIADRQAIFLEVKGGKKLPLASSKIEVTGVVLRDRERVVDSLWKGSAVRLWRSGRPGAPDSALDCGAPAGTTVIAPVSGVVERIKPYKLYGRYPDFEIHIRPDGMRQADLVVIHVTEVVVRPGMRLIGGVSAIAQVRRLDDLFAIQLAEYTGEAGNHVHIQFNEPKGSIGNGD